MKKILFIVVSAVFFLLAFKPSKVVKTQIGFQNYQSLMDLENNELFSFSIISDNHGEGPMDDLQMAKLTKWVKESNDAFVLGVGDHLQKNKSNDFFSTKKRLVNNNFYPTIADAENDYFGKGQSDWGSGAKLLNILGLNKRSNVSMNTNGAEYYAQMNVNGITVHYIVLH